MWRELRHSAPGVVPGMLERGLPVGGREQKCLGSLKVYIKHMCECFFQLYNSVCLHVTFSLHLHIKGTYTYSPVALKASKALSPFEEHRTRKRSSLSILCPRQFLGSCLGSASPTRTDVEAVFLPERRFSLPSQEAPPQGATITRASGGCPLSSLPAECLSYCLILR